MFGGKARWNKKRMEEKENLRNTSCIQFRTSLSEDITLSMTNKELARISSLANERNRKNVYEYSAEI